MSVSLKNYLSDTVTSPISRDVTDTLLNIAAAAVVVHRAIAAGRVPQPERFIDAGANASGEAQKPLDIFADETFLAAALASPVCFYGSEEQDEPIDLGAEGHLALAIDPLDGSSNIETNIAVGTIFSLLPVAQGRAETCDIFLQPGERQLAAGFFIYGAQLLLVMTVGAGTMSFLHADEEQGFVMIGNGHAIPPDSPEYSINSSNRRHWPSTVRRYIEDAEAGKEGPRGQNFGMRYVGSLVADTYRILQRGGVFLYPEDRRPGYRDGRLRQIYETNPIAFCIEQAGGLATNGQRRILELPPAGLHARIPFIFGSRNEVDIISDYAKPELAYA